MFEIFILLCVIILLVLIIPNCLFKRKNPRRSGYAKIDPERWQPQIVNFQQTFDRMVELSNRPVERTSVGIDIPRLASKTIVYSDQYKSSIVINGNFSYNR